MKKYIFTAMTMIGACFASDKTALITGVTGQDGSYLTELLLEKGYTVYGTKRRVSVPTTMRISSILNHPKFHIIEMDITDQSSVMRTLQKTQPDEVYNLAAMSFVTHSFDAPILTQQVNALAPIYFMEGIRLLGLNQKTKFYQASTSELYGLVQEIPQTEKTPFYPRSPYAIAKLSAYWSVINYRERTDQPLFACNGILFNHESPRRGEEFVTRKITTGLARVKLGLQEVLELGNMDSKRDWGHTKDYVAMQWMILQQDKPDDFVIATGVQHTVREFVLESAKAMGINLTFSGEGVNEIATDESGKVWVKVNPKFFRQTEVETLLGNYDKAKRVLGWEPKITFNELVTEMAESDLARIAKEIGSVASVINLL